MQQESHRCYWIWVLVCIMVVKVSDVSGEGRLSLFNEQAERIFGCSADELDKLKSQGENNLYFWSKAC
ncbi:hypothetical protein AAG906_039812 [Vitis piasezkii]